MNQNSAAETLVRISWQPKQKALWDLVDKSPQTWIGYGGSRGGAKSHAARMVIIARRLKYAGTNGLLFRKTYDDLYTNHILPLFAQYPFMRKWYNKSEKILYLPNGSWVKFGYAEHHDDIYDFFGKAFDDINVDEATDLEQDQIEFLKTCNRRTIQSDLTPKYILTMNPGRIGHTFIKRIFIDKDYRDNERPEAYAFLQAFGWDNVEWSRAPLAQDGISVRDYYKKWTDEQRFQYYITRSDYGIEQNAQNDTDRKAHLLGDWDVFAGQFFSMWRRDLHYIPNARFTQPVKVLPGWKIRGSIDYGQRTVLEVATADYEGTVYFVAECYTEHETPGERANAIADVLIERKLHKLDIECDVNMFQDLSETQVTRGTPAQVFEAVFKQRMGENKPRLHQVEKKATETNGYRITCNEAWKEYLSWARDKEGNYTKLPKLYITHDCPKLAQTMPDLIHDKKSQDGLDFDPKVGIDDPYDAAKMVFMTLYNPKKPKPSGGWAEAMAKKSKTQVGWKVGAG